MYNLCDECYKTLSCPIREEKSKAKKLGIIIAVKKCPAFESQSKRRGG